MSQPPDLARCRDLLLIKPSSFGDVVHALPSLETLARSYPQLRIHWVVNTEWSPLLEGNPFLDKIIRFPRKDLRGPLSPPGFFRWTRSLREAGPYDAALDLQGLLRSALIALASHAPLRFGLSGSREGARFFYHRVLRVDPSAHAVDRCLQSVRSLGAAAPVQTASPWLPPGDPLPSAVPSLAHPFVLLHPFSRGKAKSLTVEQVAQFCDILNTAKIAVVLAGTMPPESEPHEALPANTRSLLNETTIPQLIFLLRRAAAVVTVDSGPMHLAAALDTPLLGIHTWSDPRKVGPYRETASIWKSGEIRCVRDLPPVPEPMAPAFPAAKDIENIAGWAIARITNSPS